MRHKMQGFFEAYYEFTIDSEGEQEDYIEDDGKRYWKDDTITHSFKIDIIDLQGAKVSLQADAAEEIVDKLKPFLIAQLEHAAEQSLGK